MWGGRFAAGPSALMREINASISFDKRLWRQDIAASRAHVAMLCAQNIVSQEDSDSIEEGLDRIEDEYEENGVAEDQALEDIHMHVEHRGRTDRPPPGVCTPLRAMTRSPPISGGVRDAIDHRGQLVAAACGAARENMRRICRASRICSQPTVTSGIHLMAIIKWLLRERSRSPRPGSG